MRKSQLILLLIALSALVSSIYISYIRNPGNSSPVTRPDWDINVLDGQTHEVKADGKIWRLIDDGRICYIFIQRNKETWIPTMSCVK